MRAHAVVVDVDARCLAGRRLLEDLACRRTTAGIADSSSTRSTSSNIRTGAYGTSTLFMTRCMDPPLFS